METEEMRIDGGIIPSRQDIQRNGNNLIEVIPGFLLYKDEIRKMANRHPANCPICKEGKDSSKWMCLKCSRSEGLSSYRKYLIQYAVLGFSARVEFVDGSIVGQWTEEKLVRATLDILQTQAKDFFLENIGYLVTILRYYEGVQVWRRPVASCVACKVIFYAIATLDKKLPFEGVVVEPENAAGQFEKKDVPIPVPASLVTPPVSSEEEDAGQFGQIVPDKDAEIFSAKPSAPAVPEKPVLTKVDFLEEAGEILAELENNLDENPKAGKALAAFIFSKLHEWKAATGKKNPDTEEFFASVPFSEEFLQQLDQKGHCVLRFFFKIAEYFSMPEKKILAEGLLILSLAKQRESEEEESVIGVGDGKQNDDANANADGSTEHSGVNDGSGGLPERPAEEDFEAVAKSLLEKIKSNLREVPLVARALAAFICDRAEKAGKTSSEYCRKIDISITALNALKVGGKAGQCLSTSKFRGIASNLRLAEEEIIAEGLKILFQKGDDETRKKLGLMEEPIDPESDPPKDGGGSLNGSEEEKVVPDDHGAAVANGNLAEEEAAAFVGLVQREFSERNLGMQEFCCLIDIPEGAYALCFGDERIEGAPVGTTFAQYILGKLGKTLADLEELEDIKTT